ncbi:CE1759 family FMN reductase [Demequina flava]|uniref:CE1759 family FMN reductase n=1 Tax=Demequina flava TaxID=1095025 RepID=UPI000783A512|nr:CE1759 family FMN reductase [Demequina flava]
MNADPTRLVVVSAGASNPSSTRMLADRIAQRVTSRGREGGHDIAVEVIEVRELLPELPQALSSRFMGPAFTRAIEALTRADGIIAATPVYKAAASAAFTGFFQVLEDDLLIGKPMVLAATAGTSRHSLVADTEMRSLFAYMRALPVPTSLFAAPEDMNSEGLGSRIDRAARELTALMAAGFADAVRGDTWHHYSHEFGSAANAEASVDFDSDLMKLATGGTLSRPKSQEKAE